MTDDTAIRRLGEKTFLPSDQQWFASVSKDVNPMHMDAVAARRLLSGHAVVHGIHTLLAALDLWQSDSPEKATAIQCEFGNPVSVGDAVRFDLHDARSVIGSVDGLTCTRLDIGVAPASSPAAALDPTAWAEARRIDGLTAPLEEAVETQVGRRYALPLVESDSMAGRFPSVARALSPAGVAAIAALSRFVGMVCPGLHSVFSSLKLTPGDPLQTSELRFVVTRYDPRYRLVIVGFDGCIRGELRAFVRPPPQAQPSMSQMAARVESDEFRGTRSWVIGGSRGLGETVAKLLAAGRGDVAISYAAGAEDARRVADECNAADLGHCSAFKLDLQSDSFEALPIDAASLDAVYYFATPRIFRKKTNLFDRALFDEFIAFYVDRFTELCLWLEGRAEGRRVTVFLPSTAFIAERPKGMTEYAMAKAAAEVLAEDLNRSLKNVRVVCSRLPRLATDQTASIMKLTTESNIDLLLPAVRAVMAR